MRNRMSKREQALKWFDRFYWYEHYRCCDQEYEIEEDRWTDAELADFKECLEDPNADLSWDVPLYFLHHEVGTLTVDLRKIFGVASDELRWRRRPSDGTDRRLNDAEFKAPLTTAEIDEAATITSRIAQEFTYERDLPDAMYQEVQHVVPAVNQGAATTLTLLRELWSIEGLRSRRLLRALYAIGWANGFQQEVTRRGKEWRDEIDLEDPQKLRPVGVSTESVARAIVRLLSRNTSLCRPLGRPRKVDRADMPHRYRAAREVLKPFHQKLKRLHSPSARGRLRQEFGELTARLDAAGVLTRWINGPCPRLEDAAAELLAAETGLSPLTVKRYGKSAMKQPERGFLHR